MNVLRAPSPVRGVADVGGRVRRMPWLLETLGVLAAIAALLPAFARLADIADRDTRFADPGFWVEGLPQPTLPAVCKDHAAAADPLLVERLCAGTALRPERAVPRRLPPVLDEALARAGQAFLQPVQQAGQRVQALQLRQREGLGELRELSDTIGAIEARTRPFVERYELAGVDVRGPAPLVCADYAVGSALADAGHDDIARANALLLVAAALDGHAATESLADVAALPAAKLPAVCNGRSLAQAVSAAAGLMHDARQSLASSRKNEAMRTLLGTAGPQWAAAMLLGFALLVWSRRGVPPSRGAACALGLWAVAGWAARVPWPLAAHRAFEPMRVDTPFDSPPSGWALVLLGVAILWLMASLARPRATPTPQAPSSRLGYPGLVLATGLGWLLLLDLSAHGHAGNRYLGLYHQGHLWLGMAVFSMLLFLRQPIARGLAWSLSVAGEAGRAAWRRLGPGMGVAVAAALTAALLVLFALALSNMRQLTSELGRVWVIVGAAWFFFLRGDPLAQRLARSGGAGRSALRYLWPLLFVAGVLVAFMLLTRDMGPLLIACYASGALLGASVAAWWHERSGGTASAFLFAVALFAAWIGLTTAALFKAGSLDAVTAARLESLAVPFASTNDQLALVSWFQHATPAEGFGIGAVPWCGHASAGGCGGVPAQIHSDYTLTAIAGVFGPVAAWTAAIACAFWLHRLVRHHGRVTRGEPRWLRSAGGVLADDQAFLSWICVAWVVLTLCQLAVTVAGNLAVLPLTGVTFPFVSFGMTSLLVNMAFLALSLQVDVPPREDA
ncbi:MAG TPA: FtsW/RodA/SpoVE family cell cycle protein [Albitalea sp.]|uniref:FtsW/RodA/SpoVE family cell cycle protein n=1 Tax=Piscinibacter sp. TaxID=1903157 RepID=UPI002ED1ED16